MAKKISFTTDATKGGLLWGKTDKNGGVGMKAEVIGGGTITVGGGESVINEQATKENCELLSEINQSTGGRPIPCDHQAEANTGKFENGGAIPTPLFTHLYKDHHDLWEKLEKPLSPTEIHKIWDSEMKEHFAEEEKELFPYLLKTHPEFKPQIDKILKQHDHIRWLIEQNELSNFAEVIKEHIKLEESIMEKVVDDPYDVKSYTDSYKNKNSKMNTELLKGIAVEHEHKATLEKLSKGEITVEQAIVETAKDHLREDSNYYTKLKSIEQKMKNGGKVFVFPEILKAIMPLHQQKVLKDIEYSEHEETLLKLAENASKLKSRNDNGEETIMYLHYFYGGMDWYISEWDKTNGIFFGFANLNDDQNAEWGSSFVKDIVEMGNVELDFYFIPTAIKNINVGGNFYYKEKEEEAPFVSPDPVINKEKSDEGLNDVTDNFNKVFGKESPKEKTFKERINVEKTSENFADIRQSLDEFFTPKWTAEIMYNLAVKHGFSGGSILEPSMGHGVFFDVAVEHGAKQEDLYGFEIYKPNFDVVKNKYQKANLINSNFEYQFIDKEIFFKKNNIEKSLKFANKQFDLVIGNPPYGKHTSPHAYYFDSRLQIRYEGFFIYLALKKLKKGGLLVFVINSLWLQNGQLYNWQKEQISKYGELIDAYRLPNKVFKDTDIATDIVIFKRK